MILIIKLLSRAFIEFNQNKQIKTRPIKGTMPRYKNAEKDFISKQTLKNSQKTKQKM